MKINNTYTAPEAEIIELRLDANVMQTGSDTNSANSGYDDNNDLGEI